MSNQHINDHQLDSKRLVSLNGRQNHEIKFKSYSQAELARFVSEPKSIDLRVVVGEIEQKPAQAASAITNTTAL